jgi:GNAT superfamily N-acetyltransferase
MWWRLPRSTFNAQKGAGNKRAMKQLVTSGEVPGLIAYRGAEPVGWIAIAPRERFPVLGRSRVLAPVDERPVWSVVCFFVRREFRRHGLTSRILYAASAYAATQGARIVEGYPVIARRGKMPDAFAYTGLVSSFEKAGFNEVCRRSATRPIMRRAVRRGGGRG